MKDDGPHEIEMPRLVEIYSRTAAFYDQVVAEHQAHAKLTAIDLLARGAGERFLDVGLGTGWAFERVLSASGSEAACGLDPAPGMVEVARDRLAAAGFERTPILLGDATHLPFRDAAFDCALCTYTLEVLSPAAAAAALQELRRVLRHEGRLAVADVTFGLGEDAAFSEQWQRGFDADPDFFGGARPLRLQPLLIANGFRIQERRYCGGAVGWPSEVIRAVPA